MSDEELKAGCPGEVGNTGKDKDAEEEVVLWGREDQKLYYLGLARGKSSPQYPKIERTLSKSFGEMEARMS